MKDRCYMLGARRVFVQGGKTGDEIILLPGLKHIFDETGVKPVVVVAKEFANIFDGVSYAEADPVAMSWWADVYKMRLYAEAKYGCAAITPKWWDDKTLAPPPPPPGAALTTIQFNGRDIVLAANHWESYQISQWESAGFTRQQMLDWPLVFDRRNEVREAELRRQMFKTAKPKLLVAISGPGTSPFPAVPEVMHAINQFRGSFEIIDLSRMHATRFYDLLGLYDHAAGLIVNDSAPAHLAAASTVPTVWFINNGGSGSVPRGNVALTVRYANVMAAMAPLARILEGWKTHDTSSLHRVSVQRPRHAASEQSGGGNLATATMV